MHFQGKKKKKKETDKESLKEKPKEKEDRSWRYITFLRDQKRKKLEKKETVKEGGIFLGDDKR